MRTDEPNDDDTCMLTLAGVLLDEADQPVGGARIYAWPGHRHVTSAADGTFAITGVNARGYRVSAYAGDLRLPIALVTVRRDREPVTLRMARGSTLRLQVVDDAGAAVAGARIVRDQETTAITDANGVRARPRRAVRARRGGRGGSRGAVRRDDTWLGSRRHVRAYAGVATRRVGRRDRRRPRR